MDEAESPESSFDLGLDLPEVPQKPAESAAYRVLARKYRPQTFSELIGQDAMVQTLANAIARGRIAHVRGVRFGMPSAQVKYVTTVNSVGIAQLTTKKL